MRSVPAVQSFSRYKYRQVILFVVLVAILLVAPRLIGQYWNYTMGTVGIYVLLGLGLNIVVGFAGLLDLGYVAFFAIGAYTVGLLTAPEPHGLMMNFWLALPIGVLVAGMSGVLLGIPVLRMRGDYLAIVTLGFGEIIRILSKSDVLTSFSGGPRGVRNIGGPEPVRDRSVECHEFHVPHPAGHCAGGLCHPSPPALANRTGLDGHARG